MNKLNRLGEHTYKPDFSDSTPLEIGDSPSAFDPSAIEDAAHPSRAPSPRRRRKKKKKKKKKRSAASSIRMN